MDSIFIMEDHLALSAEYLELEALLDSETNAELAIELGIEIPSLSSWYDQQNH